MSASHTPSLEYLNTVWQYLPQGHEKALKQAFYNTIANIFVVIAAVVAVTVYFILAPFIRPLVWALLCGTFLYPFKRSLTNVLRQWLKGLNRARTPFGVGLAILPLQLSNSFAELVTSIIWAHIKIVFGLFFGLPILYWIYYFTPVRDAGPLLLSFIGWLYEFLEYFSSKWVWTFFAAYLIGVAILWKPVPSSQRWLRFLSAPAWVSMLLHFANAAGPLRVPLFILMIISIILGAVFRGDVDHITSDYSFAEESRKVEITTPHFATTAGTKAVNDNNDENKEASSKLHRDVGAVLQQSPVIHTPMDQTSATNINTSTTQLSGSNLPGVKPSSLLLSASHVPLARPSGASGANLVKSNSQQDTKTSMVDQCFMTLFWGHVIVRIWMHAWLMCLLLLLPILHVAIRKIVKQFCSGGIFHMTATNFKNAVYQWFLVRQEVLMPRCLKGLWKLIVKGDQQVIVFLEQGLDQATSILFILMMLVGTVLFSVIGAVQVQRETMHMVSAAQNLLNKTSTEFSTIMPNAEMMRKTMDQVLEKTHQHGRNFIASKVREFLPVDQDSAETENITNQVLEMWDKLYETMLQRQEASSNQSRSESPLAYMWQAVQNGKAVQLSGVVEFVKENLDTFMSVWESVWTIMKNNLNLFLTVVTTILSALLGGGTAILNFVISAIIFLTTLFYLLASSGDTYKPAELFSRISPGSSGSRFGSAVEHAISGVFKASLKMAAFYGLYTWLVHLIFGLDIVFIPSALAAMFAAVPFLSPYWASLPAVIMLWLVENDGVSALLLFLAHMAPVYVVDAAIYREIEGSHPYVTGLAIAGGMLLLGLEGAIIGPIILCCLIVVLNMYGSMLQNEPTTPSPVLWPARRSISSGAISVLKSEKSF